MFVHNLLQTRRSTNRSIRWQRVKHGERTKHGEIRGCVLAAESRLASARTRKGFVKLGNWHASKPPFRREINQNSSGRPNIAAGVRGLHGTQTTKNARNIGFD